MADELYGKSGAPDFFGTTMGREGGGGWIADPMPHGPAHGKGLVMQPPARDPERNFSDLTGVDPVRGANPDLMRVVDGWAGPFSSDGGWY